MGSSQSDCIITDQLLDDYRELTYLNKSEIISLWKKFRSLLNANLDINARVPTNDIMEIFPEIKYNPYRERICKVFSSLDDGHLSFEDVLDFFSVMSEKCPSHVKALWAFRIFDFNEDKAIDKSDFLNIIDTLTAPNIIDVYQKEHIIQTLLDALDIEKNMTIGPQEFEHAISKMSSFNSSFTFTV